MISLLHWRKHLVKKFIDGSFDLSQQNCTSASKIDWVRPSSLSSNPQLFPKDSKEDIDLKQGNLGDCWLIATLAMLYSFDRGLLHNLLVEYRPKLGIVLCRFCKEGEWVRFDRRSCSRSRHENVLRTSRESESVLGSVY